MKDPICADCAGYDYEWMHQCQKHKCEFCRGCECPYCAEEAMNDDEDELDSWAREVANE